MGEGLGAGLDTGWEISMANHSKHYIAGWKWGQAKTVSAKGIFNWSGAAASYLRKLGMEGWLDSSKHSLSPMAISHTEQAEAIRDEYEKGIEDALDDYRDYKRYEGRYSSRESGDPLIRTPNGLFTQSAAEAAKDLAREFHGRDNKGTKEYTLASYYPANLAELGILIELQVFVDKELEEYIPINFAPEHPDLSDDDGNVVLAATKKQLYFVGGDQEYDIEEFADAAGIEFSEDALEKDEIVLGQVKAIAYFADKHHLEGPEAQKKGIPYQHEFAIDESTGEQIGEYPTLVYCQKDKVFKLIGGSYEVLPEGISG